MGDEKTVALNRRARHEFTIDDTFEAGIVLTGTEIKSIRAGKANLSDAYARIERGEAWLVGAHIAPFEAGNRYNHEPKRTRKLLLHRSEIDELLGQDEGQGPDDRPAAAVHQRQGPGQGRARAGPRQAAPRPPPRHRRPRRPARRGRASWPTRSAVADGGPSAVRAGSGRGVTARLVVAFSCASNRRSVLGMRGFDRAWLSGNASRGAVRPR